MKITIDEEQRQEAKRLSEELSKREEEQITISLLDFYIIYHKVLEGLIYIQNRRYIHRDLKNDNVLVSRDLSIVKISDLQTAIHINELSEETKGVHGSINYVAPEVVLGENPSFASDVYSLGTMMYQNLIGNLPMGYSNSAEITKERFANKKKYDTAVQKAIIKVPTHFRNIIEGCLRYEPKKRPTIAALYAEFDKNARLIRNIFGLR